MYGAILGDMIGAPYEGDRGKKTKDFELFTDRSRFTDDTVMTIAVASALMHARDKGKEDDEQAVKKYIVGSMRHWGKKYPRAGYGGRFYQWLHDKSMGPYNSYGNGSAMRVSSIGWLYNDIYTVRRMAAWSAAVTHNHPEGIKGAEAVASAVFLARTGKTKDEIKQYIMDEFGYDLNRTCDEIRPHYHNDISCQGSVPEAITAFLDGKDLEDVIRTAVSLGGDTDTIACMAGAVAHAYYGLPIILMAECKKRLPKDILEVLDRFDQEIGGKRNHKDKTEGNERIVEAIKQAESPKDILEILEQIIRRIEKRGEFILPVEMPQNYYDMIGDIENIKVGETIQFKEDVHMKWLTLKRNDDTVCYAAFTSLEEMNKGATASSVNCSIREILEAVMTSDDKEGLVINPWENPFFLDKELIRLILNEVKYENCTRFAISDIRDIDEECIVIPEKEGEITITAKHDYSADYVIHARFPEYKENPNYQSELRGCINDILNLAKENNIHTTAIPAIMLDRQFYPVDIGARIVLESVGDWLFENPDYGMKIILACRNQDVYNCYQSSIRSFSTRQVSFPPEDYKSIDPKEIVAFSLAEAGAMGCPNEMIFARRNGVYVDFLESYVNPEVFVLFPWLETLDVGFGRASGIGEGWKYVDLGAGNHLFLRDPLYDALYPVFKGMKPPMIYKIWYDEVARYLLED